MGLADRDYYRADRGMRQGAGSMRASGFQAVGMWSVNTWLIVLCVAVFIIDGFLPPQIVVMNRMRLFEGVQRLPETYAIEGEPEVVPYPVTLPDGTVQDQLMWAQPILARQNGPQIGWIEVTAMTPLRKWLHFSTSKGFNQFQFWRLIGFQFLHADAWHLLVNMIGLYFFGPIVEEYLGRKRYLAFYLLCGIFGALMYLTLNLAGYMVSLRFGENIIIPGLLFDDPSTPLVGASAGIFGVIMAGAFLAPSALVLFMFLIPLRLQTFAYGLVAIALFTIIFGGQNQGGQAGHLGGALAGFYFIRHPHHLHGFFDFLGYADPTSHHYRSPGKYRAMAKSSGRRTSTPETVDRAEVDRILDKVHSTGLGSLTEAEKQLLARASEEGR